MAKKFDYVVESTETSVYLAMRKQISKDISLGGSISVSKEGTVSFGHGFNLRDFTVEEAVAAVRKAGNIWVSHYSEPKYRAG